jgi:hypothetical protein
MSHDDTEAGVGFFSHPTARFIVFNTVGDLRPDDGWPAGASGAQGTITPIESGYYRPGLQRVDGTWKFVHYEIVLDQPMDFPGA